MDINGIAAADYKAARSETRKTEINTTGKDFAKQVAEAAQAASKTETAVLHGADGESGDITVSSWVDVVSGLSMSVYKTQDFDPENPIYKVKIWDKSGNVTEQMVDVSKVDPKNCNTAEMYAYTANLKERGKGNFEETVLKTAVAKAVKNGEQSNVGSWNFLEKTDWVKIVDDIMQMQYKIGNMQGYLHYKNFLDLLIKDDLSKDTPEAEEVSSKLKDAESKTEVVVRPDGSKVLLVTMQVGGMQKTTSVELSKPTDMQNNNIQDGDIINDSVKNAVMDTPKSLQ